MPEDVHSCIKFILLFAPQLTAERSVKFSSRRFPLVSTILSSTVKKIRTRLPCIYAFCLHVPFCLCKTYGCFMWVQAFKHLMNWHFVINKITLSVSQKFAHDAVSKRGRVNKCDSRTGEKYLGRTTINLYRGRPVPCVYVFNCRTFLIT
jgi:hypothetical protein